VLASDFYQIVIQFTYHICQSSYLLTAVTYCITCSSKKNMNAWLPVVTAKFWLQISQSAFGRWVSYFWVSYLVTYGTEEVMNHIQRS
jgi:hypothetical protein